MNYKALANNKKKKKPKDSGIDAKNSNLNSLQFMHVSIVCLEEKIDAIEKQV